MHICYPHTMMSTTESSIALLHAFLFPSLLPAAASGACHLHNLSQCTCFVLAGSHRQQAARHPAMLHGDI
jgi:hypothetical protein